MASIKLGYQFGRIQLKADGVTFTVVPVFVMPYMTAMTEDVEKALFLRRFNIPYWGLTYVYGHDDMYWYRLEQSFGRLNIVGTTVKQPDYAPDTVNTDGWAATQNAWRHWFTSITVILCFLHAYIKIRDRATKVLADSFNEAASQVWEAYEATTKASFSQRHKAFTVGGGTCSRFCDEEAYSGYVRQAGQIYQKLCS